MFQSCLVASGKIIGKDFFFFKAASPLYNTEGVGQGELKETSKKYLGRQMLDDQILFVG